MARTAFSRLRGSVALGLVLTGGTVPAFAGPEGGAVTSGAAAISRDGAATTIAQTTAKVSIDWRSFDIDQGEAVRFSQPDSGSVALNRVTNALPTEIQGELTANGNVWIVNPKGVVFGRDATVDVGGLLASTSSIGIEDFAAGRGRFAGDGAGRVANQGTIRGGSGGVTLAAPTVENSGSIEVIGADLQLHAGAAFTVDMEGDGLLSFSMASEGPEARRLSQQGALAVEGGSVRLSAAATDAVLDSVISAGGVVEATGIAEVGGRIVLTGGGLADVSGSLGATAGETGGSIALDASRIVLRSGASLAADGAAGGGEIAVGARDGASPNDRVVIAEGAGLSASATRDGDGGSVSIWSEKATAFFGSLTAEGAGSGSGGFADISSAGALGFGGQVALGSPNGPGTLLFDPRTIVIETGYSESGMYYSSLYDDGQILRDEYAGQDLFIAGYAIEAASTSSAIRLEATDGIYVRESSYSSGSPALTLANPMTLDSGGVVEIEAAIAMGPHDLTVLASGGIDVSAPVTSTGGSIVMRAGPAAIGSGPANPDADIDLTGRLSSDTGALTLAADGDVTLISSLGLDNAGGTVIDAGVGLFSNAGDVTIAAGGDARLYANVETGTGDIGVTAGGDIFVETLALIEAERVAFAAGGLFWQDRFLAPPVVIFASPGMTIVGDGAAAGDGVLIEAEEVRVFGRVEAPDGGGITVVATGDPTPQTAAPGTVTVGLSPDGPSDEAGALVASLGAVDVTASDDVVLQGDVQGTTVSVGAGDLISTGVPAGATGSALDPEVTGDLAVDLTAERFDLAAFVSAPAISVTLRGDGFVGAGGDLDLTDLEFLSTDVLQVAALGTLTVDDFLWTRLRDFGAGATELTLTAGSALLLTGDLAGIVSDGDGGSEPLDLFLGDPSGQRPTALTATGRIGVVEGPAGPLPLPPDDLGFFVDGPVLLDPPYSDGETILAATGLTTIDATGDFLQRNTLDPGATEELVHGIGGAGAVLGPVLLVNAGRLELYGVIDGLSTRFARLGVEVQPPFAATAAHQVNDCALTAAICDRLPVVADDFGTTPVGEPLVLAPLDNDSDADGDPLAIVALGGESPVSPVAGSGGGLFTLAPDGSVLFEPGGDFDDVPFAGSATTSISYEVSDGFGGFAEGFIVVEVFRPGAPPEFFTDIPLALPDPVELTSVPLSPDLEDAWGFFTTIGLIEPVLEEEEPITNRGNEEEWPR